MLRSPQQLPRQNLAPFRLLCSPPELQDFSHGASVVRNCDTERARSSNQRELVAKPCVREPSKDLNYEGVSRLPSHIRWTLVHAQPHKAAMPQMAIFGPFYEFKLPDDLRLQPAALGHLRRSQAGTPTPCLSLWQIRKGTS